MTLEEAPILLVSTVTTIENGTSEGIREEAGSIVLVFKDVEVVV